MFEIKYVCVLVLHLMVCSSPSQVPYVYRDMFSLARVGWSVRTSATVYKATSDRLNTSYLP